MPTPTRVFFFFQVLGRKFMLHGDTYKEVAATLNSFTFHQKTNLKLVPYIFQTLKTLMPSFPTPSDTVKPTATLMLNGRRSSHPLACIPMSAVRCCFLPLRRMRKYCQCLFLLSFLATLSQLGTTPWHLKISIRPSFFPSSSPPFDMIATKF